MARLNRYGSFDDMERDLTEHSDSVAKAQIFLPRQITLVLNDQQVELQDSGAVLHLCSGQRTIISREMAEKMLNGAYRNLRIPVELKLLGAARD